MELRDLEYLLACVDEGSFTRASRVAHVAQPTLSHAMKRLEEAVGTKLLHRPTARDGQVVPTEAGALVVARARAITKAMAELHEDLAALDGTLRGEVKLGAAPSLAMSFVPTVLLRMRRTAPEVFVTIETGSTDSLVERVRARSIDIALVADVPPQARAGLTSAALFDERFVVVAGGTLPLGAHTTLAQIARGPLILPGEDVFHGRRVREAFARAGAGRLSPVATLGSAEALVAAARAGLGYALLPERCVDRRDARLRIARIRGEPLVRTVHVVAHHVAAVRRVVVALREVIDHEVARGARGARTSQWKSRERMRVPPSSSSGT